MELQVSKLISTHLKEAFEGNNWSEVNVRDTVKDITFPEAVTKTKASPNTIAALLYHMTFYNKAVHERLLGREPQINAANGFDMPPLTSEADWEHVKNEAFSAAEKLAEAICIFPDEKLMDQVPPGKGSFYKKFHGVIEHNYYHLGQIVILKNLLRNRS